MMEYSDLYLDSRYAAQYLGEMELWEKSNDLNLACRKAIEQALLVKSADGEISHDCVQDVLRQYGFKRVEFVLASTMSTQTVGKNHFSRENTDWLKLFSAPYEGEHKHMPIVRSPWPDLDKFADQVRAAHQKFNLFRPDQCDLSILHYVDRVLVLRPEAIQEKDWMPTNMLWLACGGPGCSLVPYAGPSLYSHGREIIARSLSSGEKARWHRADFYGVLKDEFLPAWAAEKLEHLRGIQEEVYDEPIADGTTMYFM